MGASVRRFRAVAAAGLCGLFALQVAPSTPARADNALPFKDVLGRWIGEGRLGFRGGNNEVVKCRVTYAAPDSPDRLQQSIRCAAASGSIEVKSLIVYQDGALKGTWSEQLHNMNGEVTGTVNPNGFRVFVRGPDLSANMDIIVKETRQVIEIQFQGSSLIGLTLALTKG
jgi:hypothetical protein